MMTMVEEVPRLSGTLRVFANAFETYSSCIDSKLLETKRKRRFDVQKTWASICSSITTQCNHSDLPKIQSYLKEFAQITSDILGDEDVHTIDLGCVFLYDIFHSSTEWCKSHGEDIRKTFGPYPATLAMKAFELVKRIVSYLPQTSEKSLQDSPQTLPNEFGNDLPFSFSDNLLNGAVAMVTDDSFSEEETEVKFKENSWSLLNELSKYQDKHSSSKDVTLSKDSSDHKIKKYGSHWLETQCKQCSLDVPWNDIYQQLFDILTEEHANIEHKIVDLLGYSNLDFVQELLMNRQCIVDTILNEPSLGCVIKSTDHVARPKSNTSDSHTKAQYRPAVGSQVVIKSTEEIAIEKKMRKEEKKEKKSKEQPTTDHTSQLKSQGFDPKLLKKERERCLEEASKRPLFKPPKVATGDAVNYPNVFDLLGQVKREAIIFGKPVGLPENAVRNDFDYYEEICVPHVSTLPPQICEKILVKELDDNLKLVFKNTKYLNTIQSAVYDTAYYTNENLLISAPTGAGKTNIAMLTVMREINNNIDAGIIKKNQFKIIYVAPMKALAAEVVRNFGQRLAPLGISVRELTGDMQLTKYEIQSTQMIVTTPEKWDVVTRKSTGDVSLSQLVRLLIIDEVHLLHEDRGSVIECLVARTLRQVETSQKLIRIVGLSATLPNYVDVARFLHVNLYRGLFYFDGRFRPVPLSQSFVGIKSKNVLYQLRDMDRVCYNKVIESVKHGHQVMVFVHARNATVKTANSLKDIAVSKGEGELLVPEQSSALGLAEKQIRASGYKPLRDLFAHGFAVHHAGMLRKDRNLVEKLFSDGLIKVLVCTATLAWGVNLPAHSVIIKGTQIYDSKKGAFVDLGILDVLQIFGRAGRPQFDTFGEGTIITTHDNLAKYVSLLTHQLPIESQLMNNLADSLNAEISLGTVSTVSEAVQWLSYTYFYVRLHRNPLAYGVTYTQKQDDPFLQGHQRDLIISSAKSLDKAQMIRFAPKIESLNSTFLGRVASNFYIKYASIETFNGLFKEHMTEGDIVAMVSLSQEFEQMKIREDEISELDEHLVTHCALPVKGGSENTHGKVNILLQTYISQGRVDSFSLVSDLSYVAQNVGRIMRGLFEIGLQKGWSRNALKLLNLTKAVDHQLWHIEHPLKQFRKYLSFEIFEKLNEKKLPLHQLKDLSADDIGHMIHHVRKGQEIKRLVNSFPAVSLSTIIQPITRTVLKVQLTVTPTFQWDDRIHGNGCEPWWLWVEDPDNDVIYHSEYFLLQRKHVLQLEPQEVIFTIPIFEPLPAQYIIRLVSDRWLGCEAHAPVSFKHLILPELHPPHTKLLDLHPLPISALNNSKYQSLYNFGYFNPIQTQLFHTLYHTDTNVLLGAPTGSGKTIAAELAMFRVFNTAGGKCVYIAPLKALVRERILDWNSRFQQILGKNVIELTGDTSPDVKLIDKADIIVTTPEKWDGISRSWQNRSYVQAIRLIVIDEIHLLGDERGPVLEVIVSRTNFISSHTNNSVRIIGLSTALANAGDLGVWLGIGPGALFNFHPAVRPVQLEVHIQGFPGKHYCPRMATMNKPVYSAIKLHSPDKPVLIFVSSRRQTRLTAFDLVSYVATETNPKQWLNIDESILETYLYEIHDSNLRFTLPFGIGLHHAGLHERDRQITEELFVNQKIQILIATATLAWGVNFPAHLVIVKGTEYFDGKTQRYIDYPITDVLQMMGRAGRPQYDDHGVAVILVQDIKKDFYKKFLYEPFPVESNLLAVLSDHLNAEIVAGTVTNKQDAIDYITWTYFFRRLLMNPSYYQLEDKNKLNQFLTEIVDNAINDLLLSYCIILEEDERTIEPTVYGCIASYYYLHHKTIRLFHNELNPHQSLEGILNLVCESSEYDELPVRHNEDQLNSVLATKLPISVDKATYDSSHTKAHLLFQAHFSHTTLPIADYQTDTKSVLDQSLRILQAVVDISGNEGWLEVCLLTMQLVQMCVQGLWYYDSSLLILPYFENTHINLLNATLARSQIKQLGIKEFSCLPELFIAYENIPTLIRNVFNKTFSLEQIKEIENVLNMLPIVKLTWNVSSDGQDILTCNSECIVNVHINRKPNKNKNKQVYAPRFPKHKVEGWWLVLGNIDNKELVAMKRIGPNTTHCSLIFIAPSTPSHVIYTLYIISDCYLGLDQQYDIKLQFV